MVDVVGKGRWRMGRWWDGGGVSGGGGGRFVGSFCVTRLSPVRRRFCVADVPSSVLEYSYDAGFHTHFWCADRKGYHND